MEVELIPIFVQLTNQKEEQITSNSIPQTTMTFNKEVINLLNKYQPLSIISCLVHSEPARKYVREMLSLNIKDQPREEINGTILMGNKLQVGYNSVEESYNWVYFEANPLGKSKLIPMLTSITCSLLYQAQSSENDGIYLQQIINNFKLLTGKNPNIYYLIHGQESSKTSKLINCIYTPITIENVTEKQQMQQGVISSSVQNNRKILNDSFVLQNKKGKSIFSCIVPYYFKKYEIQNNFGPIEKPQNIWLQSIAQLQSQIKRKCISEYKSKMQQLYQDKKFISFKLLYSSHQIAIEIAVQSIAKILSKDDNNFQKQVTELINEQFNKIVQEVSEINLKWSKIFVESQFAHIQTRLKKKEIKHINSLKHQLNNFIDSFHRKVQLIQCKKIQQFFQHFLVQKTLESYMTLYEGEKKMLAKQVTEIKNKLSNLENEDKQLRRQKNKQSSLAYNVMEELQQKINYSKNRQELLQSALNQLKQQKIEMDVQYDNKIEEMGKTFLDELKVLQQAKSGMTEEASSLRMKIVLLEAEVEKQKQMHLQTHQHYKLMMNEFRAKEMQLQNQISEIAGKANQQLQENRQQLQREQYENSLVNTEREQQTRKLSQSMNILNKKYLQLQKAYINLQHESQQKENQHSSSKSDLQIALKLCQQKLESYQQKQPQYDKLQQQYQTSQQTINYLRIQKKQKQKQLAILKQQNKFINQKIKQFQNKYENQKKNSHHLKNNLDDLQTRINKIEKNKINCWVQTEFDYKLKKQLEEALRMTINLESQYKKVKNQNSRLKAQLE